ncbi:MAG: acyl-CoA dehydrogenase family protein [Salinirussus sp.]
MIGDDTSLTSDERDYLTNTIATLENEILVGELGEDHVRDLDRNGETAADWRVFMERVGKHDLLGVPVPKSEHGAGLGFIETALTVQAVAYVGCIIHACQVSMSQHGGRILHEHGTDHVRETYLRPWLAGEKIAAQAFTEPTSGTDLAHMQTTAEREGDSWVITGEKRFIDFAGYADFMLVPVRTGGSNGDRSGISYFVVDADADGLETIEHQSDWHGYRGSDAQWLRFDGVRVPNRNLVGEPGGAWPYITDELNLEHVTMARYCLGAAEEALEVAANYTLHREVDERPIADYQGVNHQLAECVTKMDAAYLLNTRAARCLDEGGMGAGRLESAMTSYFGNEVAFDVADTAMQVMGGIGTTDKYPVERIQRDMRTGRFLGGATEVIKNIIQHDAYERLADDRFDADLVGREYAGRPWSGDEADAAARSAADD